MTRPDAPPRVELRGLGRGRSSGAVLVLNGARGPELRTTVDWVTRLGGAPCVVAVDGGLRTCRAAGLRPGLFVGDGDSARRIPSTVPAILYPADKEFSDLAGALGELARRRVRVVGVAGLLGGRVDHEWANLHEIGSRAKSFAGLLAPTPRGTVVVTARGCRIETVPGRTLSLIVLGGSATVTLRGTRWELERRRLRPGSRGLSNVAGEKLDLVVHAGAVAVVIPPVERG